MTTSDRFDRSLPGLLAEIARVDASEALSDVLAATSSLRQRPAWQNSAAWRIGPAALPAERRSIGSLPIVVRLGLVAALLLSALGGAVFVGSRFLQHSALPPQLGTLVRLADMQIARVRPVAVRLPDGRVLVAGGGDSEHPVPVELFDPARGVFQAATGTSVPGVGAGALLPDGTVLLLTFDTNALDSQATVFDPRTMTLVATPVPTTLHRESATLTSLLDGRVLLAGGRTDQHADATVQTIVSSAELYDPVTRSFAATGSLGASRLGASATRLGDGRVLVVGGGGPPGAELYDPRTGTFTPTGGPHVSGPTLGVATPDGGAVVFETVLDAVTTGDAPAGGHRKVDRFDPATGTFTALPDLVRTPTTATGLSDGRILLTADLELQTFFGTQRKWSWVYDPATGSTEEASAPAALGQTPVLMDNGGVLLLGGRTIDLSLGDVAVPWAAMYSWGEPPSAGP